jgi:hypothetical protein|tara:strand:- start:289 stop:522 length:234 start_codon:yes stop_codon:yes gene_type:complete
MAGIMISGLAFINAAPLMRFRMTAPAHANGNRPGFTFDHHTIDPRCQYLAVPSISKLTLAPSFFRGHRSRQKLHLSR